MVDYIPVPTCNIEKSSKVLSDDTFQYESLAIGLHLLLSEYRRNKQKKDKRNENFCLFL